MAGEEIKEDSAEETSKKAEGLYRHWSNQITDALTRERQYRRNGRRCVELYEARHPERTPFAILYSNTETLQPAVYNNRPIPVVDRRFKDADPVGKIAADVGTRLLKFMIDAESAEYDNFDELMQPAVLDSLVVNRGLTRFKYDADTARGEVRNDCVYGEAIRWDKFFHGYSRTWKKVPWIGFEHDMTKEEAEENFPDAKGKLQFDNLSDISSDPEDKTENSGETREEKTGAKLAKVYEIWDKITRKVYFFSPVYKEGALKIVDDPLELSGYFPVPKPMNFMKKISTLVPTPLYIQYEQQAKELNEITVRLKNIVRALKVRGMYNSTIQGIDKVLESEDNTLTPAENMASMPDGSGMDKIIWLMPLDNLAAVALQLSQQREQIKQVIYEITGISDILRGASVASETATAQNIKNQWGTLRLKKMQKEVQRYCRDSLRIILEIAVTKLQQPTIAGMTGLELPTDEMKKRAEAQVQQIIQQAQQQAMLATNPNQPVMPGQEGQPPAQPAAPPQPPQIPPELQKILQTPSWEQVIGTLKNDVVRSYKVDIETNSTIDAEASQDKQDISELLNALSQFLNGIAPLIENGSMPFDVAKNIMLAIARRYTFGPQLEDALQQMKPPESQKDPAADAKAQQAQMDLEKGKQDMELAKQQAQIDLQKSQSDLQVAQELAKIKIQEMQMDFQMKQAELELKKQELGIQAQGMSLKAQAQDKQHQLKMQSMEETAAFKSKQMQEAPKETSVAAV